MPGMKITLDAAMRARDVSRPHAEHEDQAVANEPQYARARDPGQNTPSTRGTPPAGPAAAETAAGVAARPASGGAPKGRSPRRRRRRR
jgi:hypothetical protein